MNQLECKYCGYSDFEEEEDTGILYCVYCGHYFELSMCQTRI